MTLSAPPLGAAVLLAIRITRLTMMSVPMTTSTFTS